VTHETIDLAAASRISRRVSLQEIRLVEIRATSKPGSSGTSPLVPTYDYACVPIKVDSGVIEVACSYNFKVHAAEEEMADARITYHIIYTLIGEEPAAESDIEQFAHANGAYHSWPFVRESIYSLTGRMGFPPYTLPVLSFLNKTKSNKAESAAEAKNASAESGDDAQ